MEHWWWRVDVRMVRCDRRPIIACKPRKLKQTTSTKKHSANGCSKGISGTSNDVTTWIDVPVLRLYKDLSPFNIAEASRISLSLSLSFDRSGNLRSYAWSGSNDAYTHSRFETKICRFFIVLLRNRISCFDLGFVLARFSEISMFWFWKFDDSISTTASG